MNFDKQKTLATLANPKWKTQMNLDLIDAQAAAARQAEHDRIADELDELIDLAHERNDESMGKLLCSTLALYQRKRWDL